VCVCSFQTTNTDTPQERGQTLSTTALVEFQDSIDFVYIGKMTAEEFHANADELLKNGMEANAQSSREEYETRDARLAELRKRNAVSPCPVI
jgi:hypothetical protein